MKNQRAFFVLIMGLFWIGCVAPPQVVVPPSPTTTLPRLVELATHTPTAPVIVTHTPTLAPSPTLTPLPTTPPITTLLFTGVIVPARCVQAALDASGNPDYPYEEVREVIQQADLAIGTFNATMSDAAPRTGCIPTYVLVGDPANADALARAGFDVMSVATNHIKDCGVTTCGDTAFLDTLAHLHRVGILPVGAGIHHAEAMQPVVVEVNGIRFGFVSLGQIEQGGVFATQEKAGIAVLNAENAAAAIRAARQVADVVIIMPHWGPEDVSTPTWVQRNLAHEIVAAGPDLVVGNHTHVVQGIQEIEGVPVFYGLGNFVFDQWRRHHQQSVILIVRFEGVHYAGYDLIPTRVDKDGRVRFVDQAEAQEILQRIEQASQGLR